MNIVSVLTVKADNFRGTYLVQIMAKLYEIQ